jgi:hypothetical protein
MTQNFQWKHDTKTGELGHWPICAVCSEACQEPTAVEEYEIPAVQLEGEERIKCLTVIARCSHGKGFRPGTVKEQHAKIDVPEWWGIAHVDDAVRSLIFFAPGHGAPAHKLVTNIG